MARPSLIVPYTTATPSTALTALTGSIPAAVQILSTVVRTSGGAESVPVQPGVPRTIAATARNAGTRLLGRRREVSVSICPPRAGPAGRNEGRLDKSALPARELSTNRWHRGPPAGRPRAPDRASAQCQDPRPQPV